jgi:hypothetical protein
MLLAANGVFLKETKNYWKYKQTFLNRLIIEQFNLYKTQLEPPQNAAATFYLEALHNLINISVLLHHHPSIHVRLGLPGVSYHEIQTPKFCVSGEFLYVLSLNPT